MWIFSIATCDACAKWSTGASAVKSTPFISLAIRSAFRQIYAGETHFGRPLYDQAGELGALKKLVVSYPPSMRRALIDQHLFDAQFEIEIALGPAGRGDVAYVVS